MPRTWPSEPEECIKHPIAFTKTDIFCVSTISSMPDQGTPPVGEHQASRFHKLGLRTMPCVLGFDFLC